MRSYKLNILILISVVLSFIQANELYAATNQPKITIDCGFLTGTYDENGTYALFNPDSKITYFGKKLSVNVVYDEISDGYVSNSQKTNINLTGSSKFRNISNLNLSHKFLAYNRVQTGNYKVTIVAIDSAKRKTTAICNYSKYYFDMPNPQPKEIGFDKIHCTFNGIKLFGSVYFSNSSSLADFSVYITTSRSLADLTVFESLTSSIAKTCGIWNRTQSSSLADFSVYISNSESLSDFSIYLTSSVSLAGTK